MNNILIIFNVLVSMMALLLYMMEVKEARIRREKVRRARTKTKVLPKKRVNTNKYDLVVKDSVEKVVLGSPKEESIREAINRVSMKDNVISTMRKPLTMNQMVKLIEANADRLTKSQYYTLQVAYGLIDVPFEVNLKDSLQWVCEQLGLVSIIEDESYLRLDYAFDNKQACNL